MLKNGVALLEKPQNGIAGLKHWKKDIVSGLVVSLISLPFSLGIAVASGAPPICGVISAIIAGLVLPFLGGSYVTISGPAAGLAPALFAAMMLLGSGDREKGYPLLLGAICIVGAVQFVMGKLKMARIGEMFPIAVVEGMLAAIGIMIIVKQIPLFLGVKFHEHEFMAMVTEIPHAFSEGKTQIIWVAAASLTLIFGLGWFDNRVKKQQKGRGEEETGLKFLQIIPPALIGAVFGLVLSLALSIDPQYRVQIPADPFKHGIVMPNFTGLFSDQSLVWPLITVVFTLVLIDGVESLATIAAVDRIDPFKRKSDPNRTLYAMGVSNMASSLFGGLTIIPGGVKSTANIVSGGRTQWANFYNAIFLIIFLLFGQAVINLLPMATLGAIVAYMGYKLCAPKVWMHMWHVGKEVFAVFAITIAVTLWKDLLWGIAAGVAAEMCVVAFWVLMCKSKTKSVIDSIGDIFRLPAKIQAVDHVQNVHIKLPVSCFNFYKLRGLLNAIEEKEDQVRIYFDEGVPVADHTSVPALLMLQEEYEAAGRHLVIEGLDTMESRSHHKEAMRVRRRREKRELVSAVD